MKGKFNKIMSCFVIVTILFSLIPFNFIGSTDINVVAFAKNEKHNDKDQTTKDSHTENKENNANKNAAGVHREKYITLLNSMDSNMSDYMPGTDLIRMD